jgi:O-antigen ligase
MSEPRARPQLTATVLSASVVHPHNPKLEENRRSFGWLYKSLVLRRRVDPFLLTIAIPAFAIKLQLDAVLFAYFMGTGIYFLAGRHRVSGRIDPHYFRWCLIYVAYAVLIGLFHGNLPKEIRWIGYPVYLLAGVLLMVGFALIKDPLRQIALGARLAAIVALPLGIFELSTGDMRVGFGGNEANTAFVMIVIALLARYPVQSAPRFLPNSRLWFYPAAIVVMMTGTRAVFLVVLLALLLDAVALWQARRSRVQLSARERNMSLLFGSMAIVLLVGVAATTLITGLSERLTYTATEFSSVLGGDETREMPTGLGIRLTLWRNAIDVIADHPLVGTGGVESMRQIKQMIVPEWAEMFAPYVHVHHFVLDELRQRGMIGLFLMLTFFCVVGRKIWQGSEKAERETAVLFGLALVSYGSLHGLMLSDRNVLLISLVLTALLLKVHQRQKHLAIP